MPVCFICKYECACIVCSKERKDMKVREKWSRGEYIDRFVDETIVFELSGWTRTLTVCDFPLVCLFDCFFVSFVFFQWTERWASLSVSLAFFFFRSRPLIVRSDVFISSRIGYFLLQPYTHTQNWPANLSTKEQFTSWLHVSYVDGKCAAHIRMIHSWLLLMQVNWATRLRNLHDTLCFSIMVQL